MFCYKNYINNKRIVIIIIYIKNYDHSCSVFLVLNMIIAEIILVYEGSVYYTTIVLMLRSYHQCNVMLVLRESI